MAQTRKEIEEEMYDLGVLDEKGGFAKFKSLSDTERQSPYIRKAYEEGYDWSSSQPKEVKIPESKRKEVVRKGH